jgi:hypothetical protein
MPLGPPQAHTLYPKNSTNQYTKWDQNNGVEPSIGAKIGSPLAPVHVSSGGHENGYDFYSTTEPWDTIWVVNRGEAPNIPYLPNYVGLSDQDFVFRVADNRTDENGELVYFESGWTYPHVNPLGLEVVQTSHAWSSAPLDEFILYQSYITPKINNLYDVYAGFWWGGQIGLLPQPSFDDDCTMYDAERYFSIAYDTDGVPEDNVPGPIGFKMFSPEIRSSSGRQVLDPETLNWTWNNFYDVPHKTDYDKYQVMSSHIINQDGCDNVRIGPMFYWFFGPLDSLVIGDTLKMTWVDPIRLDQLVEPQPFEGYRVYKSSNPQGPWTLLSEYDISGNGFYNDYGLEYTYTDDGLLNNIEYYYSVTSFSKPDKVSLYPSIESSIDLNAIEVIAGTGSPQTVGKVAVVPNPYRGDEYYNEYNPPWERSSYLETWIEQDRRIQFINLPSPCRIKVYTLAGDEVYSLNHNNSDKGYEDWNLTSSVGQTIASGIYLFTVEDLKNGDIQNGKFVVVK